MKKIASHCSALLIFLLLAPAAMADSYRYMHVTIDTPWAIFVFLLFAVLAPFVLMAVLYWHNAVRRNRDADAGSEN